MQSLRAEVPQTLGLPIPGENPTTLDGFSQQPQFLLKRGQEEEAALLPDSAEASSASGKEASDVSAEDSSVKDTWRGQGNTAPSEETSTFTAMPSLNKEDPDQDPHAPCLERNSASTDNDSPTPGFGITSRCVQTRACADTPSFLQPQPPLNPANSPSGLEEVAPSRAAEFLSRVSKAPEEQLLVTSQENSGLLKRPREFEVSECFSIDGEEASGETRGCADAEGPLHPRRCVRTETPPGKPWCLYTWSFCQHFADPQLVALLQRRRREASLQLTGGRGSAALQSVEGGLSGASSPVDASTLLQTNETPSTTPLKVLAVGSPPTAQVRIVAFPTEAAFFSSSPSRLNNSLSPFVQPHHHHHPQPQEQSQDASQTGPAAARAERSVFYAIETGSKGGGSGFAEGRLAALSLREALLPTAFRNCVEGGSREVASFEREILKAASRPPSANWVRVKGVSPKELPLLKTLPPRLALSGAEKEALPVAVFAPEASAISASHSVGLDDSRIPEKREKREMRLGKDGLQRFVSGVCMRADSSCFGSCGRRRATTVFQTFARTPPFAVAAPSSQRLSGKR